jgi:hypothetical protein
MSSSSKVEAPNTSSIATYVNMPLTKEQLKEKDKLSLQCIELAINLGVKQPKDFGECVEDLYNFKKKIKMYDPEFKFLDDKNVYIYQLLSRLDSIDSSLLPDMSKNTAICQRIHLENRVIRKNYPSWRVDFEQVLKTLKRNSNSEVQSKVRYILQMDKDGNPVLIREICNNSRSLGKDFECDCPDCKVSGDMKHLSLCPK